jgi:hypothetical protein
VSWFRSGKCYPPDFAQKYVRTGMSLVEHMHRWVGLAMPEHLYAIPGG